jgi:hypothetical protein
MGRVRRWQAWRLVQPASHKVLLQGYFSQQQLPLPGNAALVAAQQQLLDALSRQIGTAMAAHPDYCIRLSERRGGPDAALQSWPAGRRRRPAKALAG